MVKYICSVQKNGDPVPNFGILKKNTKRSFTAFKSIRLAVLGDSSTQLLVQAIKGYGFDYSVNYEIFEADYNQIDRLVFDPGSELYGFNPDFVLILRSSEKLLKDFYHTDNHQRESFAETQLQYMDSLFQNISARLSCKVIMNTFIETDDSVFGNYASKTKASFVYQVKNLNLKLMDFCREKKSVFLLDIASLSVSKGYANIFDPKMYVNGDIVFNLDFVPYVAKNIHDIIQAINGIFRKCVILDLDNTTWGGIIGDDGIEGIQIGDLGIGKAFTSLQLWIKELKKRGIIVAVCSKNTEEIAKEPFQKHADMVLRMEDIAVFVANWENKVDNIKYIQSVLNIGFDSMVFLDDNPFEREMVKQAIPEIVVPSLPEDPSEYVLYLRDLNLFETASYTEEDEVRTKQYQEEAKRNVLQKSFANEEEFLKSLQMKSLVRPFDNFTIPRIAQLSQRSNQFNLRTVRYTEGEVTAISSAKDYFTFSFDLKDIYGEYGLIAYVVLHKRGEHTLFIENWVMSCRVLKRGMEIFTLSKIIQLAEKNGYTNLLAEYIPTKKNGIVKDHYLNLGFNAVGENTWGLNLPAVNTNLITFIQSENQSNDGDKSDN
jgi:FkbH-like protein